MTFGASGGKAPWLEDPTARAWLRVKLPSLPFDAGCLLRLTVATNHSTNTASFYSLGSDF